MTKNPFPKINSEAIGKFFSNFWPWLKSSIRNSQNRKKFFLYLLYGIGGIILLFTLLFFMTWAGMFGSLPNKTTLLSIRQPEASKIYSADGKLMGKYYTKNRNTLQFSQIPPELMSSL